MSVKHILVWQILSPTKERVETQGTGKQWREYLLVPGAVLYL